VPTPIDYLYYISRECFSSRALQFLLVAHSHGYDVGLLIFHKGS